MDFGDIALGTTHSWPFTSKVGGVLTPFDNTPTLAVYQDNNVVESVLGLTLTLNFDGVDGNHLITVVATAGNGYAAGSNYALKLVGAILDGVTIGDMFIASFSIQNRAAQTPEDNAEGLLDLTDAIEPGLTPRGAMRLGAAADAGQLSGADVNAPEITNAVDQSKVRISATTDDDGNRLTVSTDVTDA